jgi:outer membrane protein
MIRSIHILVYTVVFTLLLAILFGVHTASAQSAAQSSVQGPTQADDRSWQLAIALGQGQRSNPLVGGENIDINYVIDFSWYGERFFFDNGDLGYTLWGTHNLSINTLVTLNNERNYYNYLTGQQFGLDSIIDNGFGMISGGSIASGLPDTGIKPAGDDHNSAEAIDRNQHTELAARDAALNGGFELLFISPYGDVQAQVLSDVSSTHDGQEAWLSWSYPWYTRNTELALTVGMEWKSRQLVGYYYGVQPDEAFVGRPAYQGDSGTNGYVRLAGRYQLGEHWMWASMVEREFLSSAITSSPIVDDDAVTTFFTGLFYNF